jgi:N-acetylglucosamine kinase-like BadF-type ATPase
VIVGIDAGQTGIRAVCRGAEDRAGPPVAGVPRMEAPVGPADVVAALLAALETVVDDGAEVEAIGVGLSGFELASAADLLAIADGLRARVRGTPPVTIASDGVTSLLGALGRGRAGVVVAAGTGVVVLGHDGGDGWARVDGWGSLLGDDGSGFAIGHAGLRAALRSADGREGGSPALLAAAEARWGASEAVPTGILREGVPVSRVVASFAPAVAEAARGGDPVAAAIWERAGDELAASAAAACARLFGAQDAVDVARLGSLWDSGLLDAPFRAGLARRRPAARLVEAAGTSLDGAVELARPGGPAPVEGLLWRG